ncbi:MAG TPA: insulinase family protein [Lachnospiraceae bacterium]
MDINRLPMYTLVESDDLKDIHAYGYLLQHKKTGARVMVIESDDENKVFNIAFRTPPKNSTGVAHILEHSVLCGSKNFPLKDPFVELVKGSLNTFLNAMTYPDKTMYPVASCNDQDYKNLMHVYLDAVFYPNIYRHEEIFRQEGWSYKLENEEDDLSYNGVVYSEMKGAFSSAEEYLDSVIFNSLFPDTPYGVESGGDPDYIPELTYEEFLDFHKTYYHPSNSYIYMYGNMDAVERLLWMDEAYLSHFDKKEIKSSIPYQKGFDKVKDLEFFYPISDEEEEKDNAYLSYNLVLSDALDTKESVAFEVLEYALISAPGAPLKQALLDAKIGKDIMGDFQDGLLQPFFSIVAKNSSLERKEEFLSIIKTTLENIVEKGIDLKALKAGINYFEFRFREADFSSYPKGLMYGLDVFHSWLYDETKPFIYLKLLHVFEQLKAEISNGYFEGLIKKYFLENTHGAIVSVLPKKGLAKEREDRLHEKLQAYKASLSQEEIKELVEKTRALKEYQEAEESPEDMEKIPMLAREDIKRETIELFTEEKSVEDIKVLHHNVETNKIAYISLLFDMEKIPQEYSGYVSLLKSVLGYIGTKNYSYGELFNEINENSGGVSCGIQSFNEVEGKDYQNFFGIKSKVLYENIPFVFRIIKEIVNTSDMEDEKRLYEIIAQIKSRMQMSMASAGHATAAARAVSYFSKQAMYQEKISGIDYYDFISDLEIHFEEKKAEIKRILSLLVEWIFDVKALTVSLTADDEGYRLVSDELADLKESLLGHKNLSEKKSDVFLPEQRNEGFKTAGQVQYVAKAGNFVKEGYPFTGALNILKVILSYDYLWNEVRVKGGAYGCMANFKRNGDAFLVSYRDPNLRKTIEIFDRTKDYIENFTANEREMTKYIIGTISGLDTPATPSTKGAISLAAYFNKITREMLQKERDEILNAKEEDIKRLAPYLEVAMKQNNLCVVGAEGTIEKEKSLFKTRRNLK